jgi:hypothetical protein
MPQNEWLDRSIPARLGRLKALLKGRLLGEGLAWLLMTLVAVVFVTLGFDYLLHLDRPLRGTIMALALSGAAYVAWRQLIWPLCVPMDADALAVLLERRYAHLGDRLISALQFARVGDPGRAGVSGAMMARVVSEANELAGPLDFTQVVERRRMWHTLGGAALALLALGGFAAWQGEIMSLWFQRNVVFADVDWPQDTYLRVRGGPDFAVHRGEDFNCTVVAERASTVVPSRITVHSHFPSIGRETVHAVKLTEDGSRTYLVRFRSVMEPFEFYVTGGDDKRDRRRRHRVRLLDTAELVDLEFHVVYPRYMNLASPTRTFRGGIDVLSVPAGSDVRVAGKASKDLSAAALLLNGWKVDQLRVYDADAEARLKAVMADLTELAGSVEKARPEAAEVLRSVIALGDEALVAKEVRGCAGRMREALGAAPEAVRSLAGRQGEQLRELIDQPYAARGIVGHLGIWRRHLPAPERLAGDLVVAAGAPGGWGDLAYPVGAAVVPLTASTRSGTAGLTLAFALTDNEGYTRPAGAYQIRIQPDAPPEFKKFEARGVGTAVVPNAFLPLHLEVADDCGIQHVGIAVSVSRRPFTPVGEVLKPEKIGDRNLTGQRRLDLVKLNLAPGDAVRVRAHAVDTMPASLGGPNRGESRIRTFQVIRREDMEDDLIRRQQEARNWLMQVIARQVEARAKSATVAKALDDEQAVSPQSRLKMAQSGELQKGIGSDVANIADKLTAIWEEMTNNQIGSDVQREQLKTGVVQPLEALVKPTQAVAAAIDATTSISDPPALADQARQISAFQDELAQKMRAIAERMEKLKKRQELAAELLRIINWSEKFLRRVRTLRQETTAETLRGAGRTPPE